MQKTAQQSSPARQSVLQDDTEKPVLDRELFTEQVEDFLKDYCHQKIQLAGQISPQCAELWQEIINFISGGGKRIRPYGAALAYYGYGGTNQEEILALAASLEIYHAFLLIHDDVIDKDFIRHGKPNIIGAYHKKYRHLSDSDAQNIAFSTALLAGDLLFNATFEIINQSTISEELKVAITKYIQESMFYTGGGQFMDVESVLRPISQSQPEVITLNKTAIYTFKLPLICGATLAGVSQNELGKLSQVGVELGQIFQTTDDLLGVFGDQQITGKPNRTDIKEKKRTKLIKYVYDELESNQKARLDELYSFEHQLTTQEIEEVYAIILSSSARQKIEDEIASKAQKLTEEIDLLQINSAGKQALLNILKKISKRES